MEETRVCRICQEEKSLSKFGFTGPQKDARVFVCSACHGAKKRAIARLAMFEALGWKCACCGEDHPDFLTLDHADGGGNAIRKELGTGDIITLYKKARDEGWPKDKYQLLCYNCNCAKGHYGECPHKSGVTSQDRIESIKSKVYSKKVKGISQEEKLKNYIATLSPENKRKIFQKYMQ